MTNQGFLFYIRELISKGDLRTALTQLRLLLRNSPNLDDALLQSARFNDLLMSIKLGTIGNEEATVTKTQISKGILDMLRDIEEREKQPDIHAEIEKALRFTEELSEYNRIKEKIQANRGADTSELLKDKTSNDLDEKTVSRLFQNERALIALTEGGLTADDSIQKRLAYLSLAENGHIYKGAFLGLAKRHQILSISQAATPSQFIIFRGTNRTHIFQLSSIEGNIVQQFEEMMYLLRKSMPLGRDRDRDLDIYEIPMTAVTEFIANAYIHRDYSQSVQSYIQVEMYDDRIEIKSPGHLPVDVDVKNIQNTVLRNPTIAALFHLFRYAERAGTGINTAQRILEERGLEQAIIENMDSPKMVKVTIKRNFHPTNGEKTIAKYLGKPVLLPSFLIGRELDIAIIYNKLFNENTPILLISGIGGIGKTALAALYYHQFADKYTHLAWISAKSSLYDAFLTLAQPLGLALSDTLSTDEKIEIIFNALRQLSKPALLIIDDIAHIDELRKYTNALRACPNFHILLTSRATIFEDIKVFKVQPLAADDGLNLFKKYYPRYEENDHDLVHNLISIVGNHTLSIELLSKNLAQFNRLKTYYSLQNLLADIKEKGLLAIKTKPITTDYPTLSNQSRSAKLEDIIETMYNLNDLTIVERKILTFIAGLPIEPIAFDVLEKILPDTEGVDDVLLSLAQKGWLNYKESDTTFEMPSIIQMIIRHKTDY